MQRASAESQRRRKIIIGSLLVDQPDVPHLTAAKYLVKTHPQWFKSVEIARHCLRRATGNDGHHSRRGREKDPFLRKPFAASEVAAPAAQREAEEARRQLKLANEEVATLQETVRQFGAARRKYSLEPGSVGNTLRFAVVGDTHWGSLYERLDAFLAFMRMCEREGIREVYHCGDVLDGHGIYKGQAFEQYANGAAKQLEVFAEKVPRFKGVQVYFIMGNHDLSYKKLVGMNIGKAIEDLNPDWHYLGEDSALVKMKTQNGRTFNLSLVHPGGGSAYALCFDPETEILTETRGWKFFRELSPDDRVGTLNRNTMAFEWQKPTEYTDLPYEGEMLSFSARSFDLLVTPGHRMFVSRYPTQILRNRHSAGNLRHPEKSHRRLDLSWGFCLAGDLRSARRQEWQMTRCAESWIGTTPEMVEMPRREPKKYASYNIKHFGSLPIEDVAELIAWYVTEGSITKSGKQLTISQSRRVNPGYHEQILDLFRRLGFPGVRGRGRDNKDITVCSVELCDWLLSQCGRGSAHKFLPAWLKACDVSILETVLDTMVAGDGWDNGKSFCYKSISKQLRDDFSEIAIKLGYGITEGGNSISVSTVQKHPTINAPPQSVNFSGRIYCVSVPNSVVLVRRNGKAVFSGNSYHLQKHVEALSGGQKPDCVFLGHYHKSLWLPAYRNVESFLCGTFQSQTPFMAGRNLAAMLGGWVVESTVMPRESLSRSIKAEFHSFFEPVG